MKHALRERERERERKSRPSSEELKVVTHYLVGSFGVALEVAPRNRTLKATRARLPSSNGVCLFQLVLPSRKRVIMMIMQRSRSDYITKWRALEIRQSKRSEQTKRAI